MIRLKENVLSVIISSSMISTLLPIDVVYLQILTKLQTVYHQVSSDVPP